MPLENEDVLQRLAPSIVEIISDKKEDKDSTTFGTGFVVTDDGLIVTCRHVITDSQNNLMNSVKVRFHSNSKTDARKFKANIVKAEDGYRDDPSIDIAFLKLDKLPEKGVVAAELDDKVVTLNRFASIGFKKAEEFTGLAAKGEIRILTHIKNSNGSTLSPEVIQLHGQNEIEPGMSGAPILDIERDRVVGIITERYVEQYNPPAGNMAFALPVKAMLDFYPILREKNQGLTLLSKFLRAIGEEGSSIYKWIDEVYVPPIEYDEIKAALKKDRIVFITGTKEFGKTFTAVKLMYEFFKEQSYQPKWVKERTEQRGPEGADPQELVRIMKDEHYIKPHQIVYFEDPFGKTKYESYSELENYIRYIIDHIRMAEDAYVIITSREEVFKEFEREKHSEVELSNFEKKLNLKRASYSIEKKKEILENWAKVYNCTWLIDSALRELVLKSIENQQMLPTPLNIRQYIIESQGVLDTKQLRDLMKEISKETAGRFAEEIMKMKEDEKIIFLTFPYVGLYSYYGGLYINFVEILYKSIIAARDTSQKHYMDFDTVRKWFEGDKIRISEQRIVFSHPSYGEAFQYAIASENRDSARIRDIFGKVLSRLVQEVQEGPARDEGGIAYAIVHNFNNLPPDVQQLLFKLADNDKAASSIAYAIVHNFNNLPPDVQQLLFKLADNDKAMDYVASAIEDNFNNLPPDVQQLLFKLADKNDYIIMNVSRVITNNFNNLPPDVQQLLFKLADNDRTAWYVARGWYVDLLRTCDFDKLPSDILEQLLLKLADNNIAAGDVSRAIVDNFNNLPPTVQQLLFKLADNDNAAWNVADAIRWNYNRLPHNIREQLLLKLADKDRAAEGVAYTIASNFNNLPPDVQQLLFKLADNDRTAEGVAYTIASNFNNLPRNVQQLLFKLAEDDNAAWNVADAIDDNFDKLPHNIREQLLLKLADKDRAAEGVAYTIASNFNNLPPNVQQLLFKLADNDRTAEGMAKGIASNFNNLPPNVQQLLFKLADNDRAASYVADVIASNFNNLPPNVQQLLFKLADKERAAKSIIKKIASNFNNLPPNVQQLLFKLAGKDSATEIVLSEIENYSNNIPEEIRIKISAKLEENRRSTRKRLLRWSKNTMYFIRYPFGRFA